MHSFPGHAVDILLSREGRSTSVTVSDTGEGIHPDDLPHVWERFFKSSHSKISRDEGSGIGMHIVKSMFDLLEYPYDLDSVPGEGTTVTFTIPDLDEVPKSLMSVRESMSLPQKAVGAPPPPFPPGSPESSRRKAKAPQGRAFGKGAAGVPPFRARRLPNQSPPQSLFFSESPNRKRLFPFRQRPQAISPVPHAPLLPAPPGGMPAAKP